MVTPSNIFSEQVWEVNSTFELDDIAKSFHKFPNFIKDDDLYKKRTSACIVLLLETTLCFV
jgi:hypothetical protein